MSERENNGKAKITWGIFALVLGGLIGAEFLIHRHENFGLDGMPFFSAWFGFFTGIALIFTTKFIGNFLKRSEDFYEEEE